MNHPVLCVFAPMQVHPWWEGALTGGAFNGNIPDRTPRWTKMFLLKSIGQFRRANPRDSAYMVSLAREYLEKELPEARPDILVHPYLRNSVLQEFEKWAGTVHSGATKGPFINKEMKGILRERNYQIVLLFYPDAIGCGWTKIENSFFKMKGPKLLAVTGRRRSFEVNRSMQFRLLWRRFVEATWMGEMFLMLVLIPVALLLVIYDGITKGLWKLYDP